MKPPALARVRFAADTADGDEPLRLLDGLLRDGALLCGVDLSCLPPLDRLDPAANYLCWTLALPAGEADDSKAAPFSQRV